jgi:hypothetical protein
MTQTQSQPICRLDAQFVGVDQHESPFHPEQVNLGMLDWPELRALRARRLRYWTEGQGQDVTALLARHLH